jgi:hypothetical protein
VVRFRSSLCNREANSASWGTVFGRGTTVKALENVPLLGGIDHGTLVVYRDDNLAPLLQDRNSDEGIDAGIFCGVNNEFGNRYGN